LVFVPERFDLVPLAGITAEKQFFSQSIDDGVAETRGGCFQTLDYARPGPLFSILRGKVAAFSKSGCVAPRARKSV